MLESAAANGSLDREAAVMESLIAIRRAGATLVISYFAGEVAGWLR
jgi:porphobilinogen synthase